MPVSSHPIRRVLYVLLPVLALVAGCGKRSSKEAGSPPAEAPAVDTQAIAVRVDDADVLTEAELDRRVERRLQWGGASAATAKNPAFRKQLRSQTASEFVARSVLAREALARNIEVTDEELEEGMAEIQKGLPDGMTIADIMQRENLTDEMIREEIRTDIRIRKMLDAAMEGQAEVSDQEVRDFYDQEPDRFTEAAGAHARHILIGTEEAEDEAARAEKKAKAEELRQQLVEGADFAELAAANSDCPSKEKGGDLGTFPRGQMVKAFEDAAFSQPTNEVGPVVETQFGYHIIQVLERNDEHLLPFEQVEPHIRRALEQQKRLVATRALVNELRAKAKVEVLDPTLEVR